MNSKNIFNEKQLNTLAEYLLKNIKGNCIVLQGDLGTGKTRLTQSIAKQLHVNEAVSSPTFVILKEYKAEHPCFQKLLHMDAYRLNGSDDIRVFNVEELLEDKNALLVIEWPEKLKMNLEHCAQVKIRYINEEEREFEIKI